MNRQIGSYIQMVQLPEHKRIKRFWKVDMRNDEFLKIGHSSDNYYTVI